MDKFILQETKVHKGTPLSNENVFTLRLNPFDKGTTLYSIKYITFVIDTITQIKRYMIFKEISKNLVKHLHIYITTNLTLNRIRQLIKKHLPKIKGANKATHECYSNGILHDANLWTVKTYIAKDGFLIKQRGFSSLEIDEFYRIGSTIKRLAKDKTAVYKQIISIYELDKGTPLMEIVTAVYNYYDTYRARKYPNQTILYNTITQIKNNLNDGFFQHWKKIEILHYHYDNINEEKVYNKFIGHATYDEAFKCSSP